MNSTKKHVRFYERGATISDFSKFYVKEREVNGFRLIETRLPANFRIPKHSHANGSFCFVLGGAFTERKGNRIDKEYQAASMMFSPVDEVHSDQFHNTGGHCFFLEFSPRSLDYAREFSLRLNEPIEFQGGDITLISTRLYREFSRMDESSPLAIEGLAFEIMAEVSRWRSKSVGHQSPRWLSQVKDLLHAGFAENLSLSEIAAAVDVHPVHLARVFRQFNRCTLGEYVRSLRVKNASQRLLVSDASLAEIALSAGFSDQAHFCRIFKNQTGLTPTEFRRSFNIR